MPFLIPNTDQIILQSLDGADAVLGRDVFVVVSEEEGLCCLCDDHAVFTLCDGYLSAHFLGALSDGRFMPGTHCDSWRREGFTCFPRMVLSVAPMTVYLTPSTWKPEP